MKTIITAFAFMSVAFATGICPPSTTHDAMTVDPTCPGLGAQVIAGPNLNYNVYFEDEFGGLTVSGNDFDFSDVDFQVTFDALGAGTATIVSTLASFNDQTYQGAHFLWSNTDHSPSPVALGTFATGAIVPFEIITPPGYAYITGPASLQPDGQYHAIVNAYSGVPEPKTAFMLGLGLLLLSFGRIKAGCHQLCSTSSVNQ